MCCARMRGDLNCRVEDVVFCSGHYAHYPGRKVEHSAVDDFEISLCGVFQDNS
jgi:hypothetical protein